jgi:hypothetical protein
MGKCDEMSVAKRKALSGEASEAEDVFGGNIKMDVKYSARV